MRVHDGELRVEGRWSGVRGMRFLRPTLVVGDRAVLATLEHKPWAPSEDGPWEAAFPWDGTQTDLARAALEVAPSVLVPLGPLAPRATPSPARAVDRPSSRSGTREDGRSTPAVPPPAVERPSPRSGVREDGRSRPVEAATAATAATPATAASDAAPALEPAPASDAVPAADAAGAAHARAALRAAEQERDEEARAARATSAALDRARDQLEEAVRDRDAAMRTRDRLGEQRDAAVARAAAAERAADDRVAAITRDRDERVAAAIDDRDRRVAAAERDRDDRAAERDAARAERDTFRAQRDETLLAHRTLEKLLDAERAGHDRGGTAAERPPSPQRADAAAPAVDAAGHEVPLGVRAVPAARAVPADLLADRTPARPALGGFDRWALRVLAVASAICFLLLLGTLLQLFL